MPEFLLILAASLAAYFWVKLKESKKSLVDRELEKYSLEKRCGELVEKLSALSKYEGIVDIDKAAQAITEQAEQALAEAKVNAEQILSSAKSNAEVEVKEANLYAKEKKAQVERELLAFAAESKNIIDAAHKRAEEIAGDAYAAMNKAKELTDTAQAMKNIIDGYGDQYIVPTYSLLDDLADYFGYTEAGQQLKSARDNTRLMVKNGVAATCDYAELNRRTTAIRFVTDAFNGKVDSILSRTKADNFGKLEQEIKDAYAVVNGNGNAFRGARINPEYLESRLAELKWACTANALKDKEREEQRQLREQIREEEKARREYERAMKDAAKEEEMLGKAMEKVQKQVAEASDAQRAEFEAKLHELEGRLAEAKEKNQRALSMAQQTRTGHVYVISNIGSFGEEVFKIGMTRRLEPLDRVRELSDASVPFAFDVHAMIFSEDAPTLEKKLHRHFMRQQINKVNPRKEFFKISMEVIREELIVLGVEAHLTMAAQALEYRESLKIEKQIAENPKMEKDWALHQMQYESEDEFIAEE
jgi:hypothetical protein